MISKSGIQYTSAIALLTMLGVQSAQAGLKQIEIKGGVSTAAHTIDFGDQTDSGILMDGDLDFKMKFSQDVSARFDLEFDNAVGNYGAAANAGATNRFDIGVDQAYFKLNDFLFRNFSMTAGKQNFDVSLRDNGTNSWAFGDPVALVGAYATRDMDIKGYYLKQNEDKIGTYTSATTVAGVTTPGYYNSNDMDAEVLGTTGEYWLNDDSLVMAYLNYKSVNGGVMKTTYDNLFHYGVGLDYFIGESLEVYGELAGQSIDGKTSATDGSAFQVTLGGEYAFSDYSMKPTVGLEYYLQSGKDTNDPAWQNVAGGKSSSDTDSLFMEASGSTRDINAGAGYVNKSGNGSMGPDGYSVIRVNGSISPSKSTKVGLGVHFFKNEDSIGVTEDNLGTEIDLYTNWKYSQDITFRAGAFFVPEANPTGIANTDKNISGIAASSSLVF